MTRISKQGKRRRQYPKKRVESRSYAVKTGRKKDCLKNGFREHINTLDATHSCFFPKVKECK